MKTIQIISVGKINLSGIQKTIDEYKKRIRFYFKLEETIIKEYDFSINIAVEKESEDMLKVIGQQKFILCDVMGKEYSSVKFSEMLFDYGLKNSKIIIAIGGSHGVSKKLASKASICISFSLMTFNHQLFKALLYEQIYRAITIQRGLPYHK